MEDFAAGIQAQLKDTYVIVGQIGEGGGGSVYKAYHKRLQKEVVIKKMHVKSGNELKNRQEADILKNLRHSYLPQVLDFIEAGNDVYTVMDFIPGESFQQMLERNVKFSQGKIIKYARQLCEALVYLHGQNIPILHGDIKPANIMLTPSDDVCLIDFNISGFFEQNEIMAIGYSKGYAAPEQKALVLELQKQMQQVKLVEEKDTVTLLLPEDSPDEQETALLQTTMDSVFVDNPMGQVDQRSDLYSLGATLYHLLTGRRPDDGQPNLTYEQLSALSSDAFAYILTTAMAQEKERRFQTAEKMLEALDQIAKLDGRYKRLLLKQRVELLFSCIIFLMGMVLFFIGMKADRKEREEKYEAYLLQMETAIGEYDQKSFEEGYKECTTLNREDPRADYEYAVWMYRNQDYEGCSHYIQELFKKYQLEDTVTAANLYLLLGNCCYEEDDYQNAVKMLETAMGYDRRNKAIYRDLAIAYAGAGRIDDAQNILETAIENGLEEDQIYLVQGEIAESQKDVEGARELFQKCLEITKDNSIRIRAYVYYSDLDKNSTEALKDSAQMLEEGIRELPLGSAGILYERLAQMYINLEANTGDLQYSQKAIQVFKDIIQNGSASYQTYINLTILYEQTGAFEQAHKALDEAIDLYGDHYVSYKRRAFLEADEQANKDTSERDYGAFEQAYKMALALYQKENTEDAEMPLLEKVYAELKRANWL